jgi:hypothetical protein
MIPAKYKIIPLVFEFCLSSPLVNNMEVFLQQNQNVNTQVDTKNPNEAQYTLEQTALHAQFVKDFEEQLETFISQNKSSVDIFYRICTQAMEEHMAHSDAIRAFLEILDQLTQFETFMDLARDKGKREYVKFILNSYKVSTKKG